MRGIAIRTLKSTYLCKDNDSNDFVVLGYFC